MPFRLVDPHTGERRAKVHFVTSAAMPSLIFKAAAKTGKCSNTQYIQHVLVEALARDLDLDADELYAALPTPKSQANSLQDWNAKRRTAAAKAGE